MAPMKRPAAAAATGAVAKKGKSAGGAGSRQCKEVAAAMKGAAEGDYPAHVLSMLGENLHLCLGVVKEERHEFQVKVCEMISEVMSSIQAGLEAKIAGAEKTVAEADTEKASREALAEDAKNTAASKADSTEAAKKELEAAAAELKATQEALKQAQQEQKDGDAQLVVSGTKKQKIESIMSGVFVPCKEGTMDSGTLKSGIAEVSKLGKEYSFDAALMTSLPSALSKAPDVRGSFDELVVKQVEAELQDRLVKLTAALQEGAPAQEQRAAKVAEAQASHQAASAKEAACKETLKAAQAAQKETDDAAKATALAVRLFGPVMKQVASFVADTQQSLEDFLQGPLATFKELLERTNIVPEEAAVEEKCQSCGNVYMPDAKFCRQCGTHREGAGHHEFQAPKEA